MASSKKYLDFILEQLSELNDITHKAYPSGQCSRKHRKKQGDKMPKESPPERRKT